MCSHKWTAALALVVLFALPSTASNAQSKIGGTNSVKPQADSSIAGTLGNLFALAERWLCPLDQLDYLRHWPDP